MGSFSPCCDQVMVLQSQQLATGVSQGGESGWMGHREHTKLICYSLKADVSAALPVRQEKAELERVFVSFTQGTVFAVQGRKEPCSLSFYLFLLFCSASI